MLDEHRLLELGLQFVDAREQLSQVVHDLTGAQVRMKKGGLAAIEKGELKVLLRPRELVAIAG